MIDVKQAYFWQIAYFCIPVKRTEESYNSNKNNRVSFSEAN